MSTPDTAFGLVRPQEGGGSVISRDLALVWERIAPAWLTLAVLGVGAGTLWRFFPNAEPPTIFVLLAAQGPLFWLTGWSLAVGTQAALARQHRHVQRASMDGEQRAYLLVTLTGAAVLISLAPIGVLLAYEPWAGIQVVQTADPAIYTIRLGLYLLVSLLLGGAMLTALSAGVALVATYLGARLGALLWLALGVYVNARVLAGVGGPDAPGWLPPTLGELSLSALERFARAGMNYEYTRTIVTTSVTPPLLVFAAALVIITLALWLARLRPPISLASPLAAAAWTSIVVVAVRAAGQQWIFQFDAAYRFPGDWRDLFLVAALTLWAVTLTLSMAARADLGLPRILRLLWLPAVLLTATAATLPNVRADQVDQPEVLLHALLWFAPLTAGVALLDGARRLGRGGGRLTLAVGLAALLVPLDGRRDGLLLDILSTAQALPAEQLWGAWAAVMLLSLMSLIRRTGEPKRRHKSDKSLQPRYNRDSREVEDGKAGRQ